MLVGHYKVQSLKTFTEYPSRIISAEKIEQPYPIRIKMLDRKSSPFVN